MSALTRRLDATEGQVWSLAIGLVVAIALALAGIPPVVHHAREVLPSAAAAVRHESHRLPHALTPVTTPVAAVPATTVGPVRPRRTRTSASTGATAPPPSALPFGTITSVAMVPSPLGGVAVVGGRIYVATDDGQPSHLYAFDAAGRRTSDIAIGGQPQTHGRGITALATEESGTFVATDAASKRVLRVDPAHQSVTTVATIVDLPSCVLAPGAPACEPGLEDHAPLLTGVATSADRTILVADSAQGTIWRIGSSGKPQVWWQSVQQASGDGPTAIAIAPDGSVLTAVGTDLNPANATSAAVYRIPVTSDGSAGAAVLLAKLARGDQPTGIAASPDGRVFVALHATSTIVVLSGDGAEGTRLRDDALAALGGLALGAGGELFSTTRPANGSGRLLRVSI